MEYKRPAIRRWSIYGLFSRKPLMKTSAYILCVFFCILDFALVLMRAVVQEEGGAN